MISVDLDEFKTLFEHWSNLSFQVLINELFVEIMTDYYKYYTK